MHKALLNILLFTMLILPQGSISDTLYLKNGQTKECESIQVVGNKFVCGATDFEIYFNKNEVDIKKTNQAISAQKEKLLQEQKNRQLIEEQKKSMERLNAKFLEEQERKEKKRRTEQRKKEFERRYNEEYLVGKWFFSNNGVDSTITIYYKKLEYHFIQKFRDGSKRQLSMLKTKDGNYDKYTQMESNPYGEYYLDDLKGILHIYDYQGRIGIATKIDKKYTNFF